MPESLGTKNTPGLAASFSPAAAPCAASHAATRPSFQSGGNFASTPPGKADNCGLGAGLGWKAGEAATPLRVRSLASSTGERPRIFHTRTPRSCVGTSSAEGCSRCTVRAPSGDGRSSTTSSVESQAVCRTPPSVYSMDSVSEGGRFVGAGKCGGRSSFDAAGSLPVASALATSLDGEILGCDGSFPGCSRRERQPWDTTRTAARPTPAKTRSTCTHVLRFRMLRAPAATQRVDAKWRILGVAARISPDSCMRFASSRLSSPGPVATR